MDGQVLDTFDAFLAAETLAANPAGAMLALLSFFRRRNISCAEIALQACRRWRLDETNTRGITALAAAAGQSGLANAYHNPAHTRDVTLFWINLATLNDHLHAAGTAPLALSPDWRAVGLMAALGHDLGHDGTPNCNGAPAAPRVPFRHEMIAAQCTGAILAAHGLPPGQIASVTAAILATDTVDGYTALLDPAVPPRDPRLLALQDPSCRLAATLLRDADLITSAGLSAAEHDFQSGLLTRELRQDASSARATQLFFTNTVREGFTSPAGRMFMPRFAQLRAINQQRLNTPGALTMQAAQQTMSN